MDADETAERERHKARIAELEAVLKKTRALVAEAALTGFNWNDGDWTERLYANQGDISRAIDSNR